MTQFNEEPRSRGSSLGGGVCNPTAKGLLGVLRFSPVQPPARINGPFLATGEPLVCGYWDLAIEVRFPVTFSEGPLHHSAWVKRCPIPPGEELKSEVGISSR